MPTCQSFWFYSQGLPYFCVSPLSFSCNLLTLDKWRQQRLFHKWYTLLFLPFSGLSSYPVLGFPLKKTEQKSHNIEALFVCVRIYVGFFAKAVLDWRSLLAYWCIWSVMSSTRPGSCRAGTLEQQWATVWPVPNSSLTAKGKKGSGIYGWITMESKLCRSVKFIWINVKRQQI